MTRHRLALAAVAAALLAAPAARAAELDPYLPEDTESVLNLNVRQIVDSPLVKKHALPLAQEALRGNDQVQDVLKDLGFDPFKDLDRVIIAAPVSTDKDRGLVIVRGRFDVEKFKAKGEKEAKDHPDNLKIHKILGGKYTLYEVNVPDVDDTLFVALAGRDTLLASAGKDYVVDALKKVGTTDKPVLKNKKFQALLEKVDDRQSLALAAVKNPGIKDALGQLPDNVRVLLEKVQALGGGLTIGDDIKLELVVTAKTAADAAKLREAAKNGLNLLLGLAAAFGGNETSPETELVVDVIKSLRVTSKGDAVVIKGRVSGDLIEEAMKKKSK